jgi:N-dimethylarginine dimethylaminohydrolase
MKRGSDVHIRPADLSSCLLDGGVITAEVPMTEPFLPITKYAPPAFLMSPPLSLSTEDPNNVWMREMAEDARRVDRGRALDQFLDLYRFLAARSIVYLLPSQPGLQDQAYVANLAVVLPHTADDTVVVSNFRSEPRRGETEPGVEFFRRMSVPFEVAPRYFEGEADLKYLGGNVYVGAYGMRTSLEALRWFEQRFEMEVIPFEIDNEYLYHLDCSIFPIAREHVLVCTEAADPEALRAIERHASIIDVSVDNADSGMTNCVRIEDYVLCASNIEELSEDDENYRYEKVKIASMEEVCGKLGLTPVFFNLSEFMKSGAMLSCMVMHLNHRNF